MIQQGSVSVVYVNIITIHTLLKAAFNFRLLFVYNITTQLSLDQNSGSLSFYAGKALELMREKGERAEELEIQIQKLERDNESLQKKVASLGITCEKVWSVLPG